MLGLLVLVAALAVVAGRLAVVPYPIVLVLGGLLIGLVPALPDIELAPELVFLLLLPPLVYIAAFCTPVRDFDARARPILSLAIGLVLATTAVVAWSPTRPFHASTGRPPSPWARSFPAQLERAGAPCRRQSQRRRRDRRPVRLHWPY